MYFSVKHLCLYNKKDILYIVPVAEQIKINFLILCNLKVQKMGLFFDVKFHRDFKVTCLLLPPVINLPI